MSTALLLLTVHLNLDYKVNDIVVPETLGDEVYLVYVVESLQSGRCLISGRHVVQCWFCRQNAFINT